MKKILFLLGISVFLGGCSLVVMPKNSQADLTQKVSDLQKQLAETTNQKNIAEVKFKTADDILKSLPNEGLGITNACYWPKDKTFKEIFPDFNIFDVPLQYGDYLENGVFQEICKNQDGSIAFVMYGDYGENNNLIGYYALDSATGGQKMLINFQYNKGMGDIGVCAINGFMERNLIYSCGGGDGPGGFNTVYLLERATGKSIVIKKCEYLEDKMTCTVNPLNIKGLPY